MDVDINPVRQRGADRRARALSSSAIDVDRSIDRVPWSCFVRWWPRRRAWTRCWPEWTLSLLSVKTGGGAAFRRDA